MEACEDSEEAIETRDLVEEKGESRERGTGAEGHEEEEGLERSVRVVWS